jgi:hypothetical protein
LQKLKHHILQKFIGYLLIIISIIILINLALQASQIYEELPVMWKRYQANPDELQMKGQMDKLLIWVLHLVIPAILVGTGRYMIRAGRANR